MNYLRSTVTTTKRTIICAPKWYAYCLRQYPTRLVNWSALCSNEDIYFRDSTDSGYYRIDMEEATLWAPTMDGRQVKIRKLKKVVRPLVD